MIDRTPTRTQIALAIGGECVFVTLAFVAGFGGYFSTLKEPPRIPEDYLAAAGAGALLALAKLMPGAGGGDRRG